MALREQLERLVDEMVTKGSATTKPSASSRRSSSCTSCSRPTATGKAADLLGIHRNTLARKMTEYRLRRSA